MAAIHNMMAGNAGLFPFAIVISTDYNTPWSLNTALAGLGWNGVDPVIGTVTVNSGIVVGSNSASTASMTFGTLPLGSDITLTNNGYIVGMGGQGGDGGGSGTGPYTSGRNGGNGLYFSGNTSTDPKIKIVQNGVIAGGGGGGGGAYSGAQTYRGPAGGGGASNRNATPAALTGYGQNLGYFNSAGAGLVPTGNGNSGSGGGWGGGGAQGWAWPGDYVVTNGGSPGYAVVGSAGFTNTSGGAVSWGTTYGSIA